MLRGLKMVLVLFLGININLKAQDPATTDHPYYQKKAKILMKKAQEAHGLDGGLSHLQSVAITLEGSDRWLGQGRTPDDPYRIRYSSQKRVFDFENNRYYMLYRSRNDFEQTWCSKVVLSTELSYTNDCHSRKYQSFDLSNSPDVLKSYVNRFSEPRQYLEDAFDHIETVQWERQTNEKGQKLNVISYIDLDSSRWELSIDNEQNLVHKVKGPITPEYQSVVVPAIERVYRDYKKINEVYIPFERTELFGTESPLESRFTEVKIMEINVDTGIADSLFEKPDRIIADTIEAVDSWTHTEVADGVHLIERIQSNYNAVFIEHNNFVVLFDAPIDDRISKELLTRIDFLCDGKPVKYVIASHFHYDHIGGIKTFGTRGATVIAPYQINNFMKDFIGISEVKIEEVINRYIIGEGSERIEIHSISDNPHSEAMLYAYLPSSNAVVVADLFWKEYSGQLRPARRQTRLFYEQLKKINVEVATLIPIHGPLSSLNDLKKSIN